MNMSDCQLLLCLSLNEAAALHDQEKKETGKDKYLGRYIVGLDLINSCSGEIKAFAVHPVPWH